MFPGIALFFGLHKRRHAFGNGCNSEKNECFQARLR